MPVADLLVSVAAVFNSSPPPPAAFIVGVPRSGTTLLRMMMDSHPEVAVPPETHFYFELFKLAEFDPLTRTQFVDTLAGCFSWQDFDLRKSELEDALSLLEPFDLTKGLRTFYALYAARFGKLRWGEKTPDYGGIMTSIQRLLPEARFIHLIRDGRDLALSRRGLWFGPGASILAQAEDWAQTILKIRAEGSQCAHYLELRYEDLVTAPEEALQKICAFLELEFRGEMLRFHELSAHKLDQLKGWPALGITREQLRGIAWRTTQPLESTRTERWKSEMSRDEILCFEEIAAPLLTDLGYETRAESAARGVASQTKPPRRKSSPPSVSALLLTDGMTDDAWPWFQRLRAQVDEFVIWIDSQKASQETEERARELADRIEHFEGSGICDLHLGQAYQSCRGDWVLRVDSDEELSPEWETSTWRELLTDDYTSFALPRYWLTSPRKFLAAQPWLPDYQVRLIRNQPSKIRFPRFAHGETEVDGRRGFLRSLALHHHVLHLNSRADREKKVRFYQTLQCPDLGYFYLFEDHGLPAQDLPTPSIIDPEMENLRMGMLREEQAHFVSLELEETPAILAPGQLAWARVRVKNSSDRQLCSVPPFPVYLSYHWLDANSRQVVVFNGSRTPFFPPQAPGRSTTTPMFLSAPTDPGNYILQVSLVQDGVRWFESANPGIVREAPVRVVTPTNATKPGGGRLPPHSRGY